MSPLRAAASTSSGRAHIAGRRVTVSEAASCGRRRRLLVASEPVAQDGGAPVPARGRSPGPWPRRARSRSPPTPRTRLRSPCSARSRNNVYGAMRLPVAAATLSLSAASDAAPGEVAGPRAAQRQLPEVERELRHRAGVAHELDVSRRDRVEALDVPHQRAGERRHPAPPQDVLEGNAGERVSGALQGRGGGGVAVGDQQREPVEQQVERQRGTSRRRERLDGAADLEQDAPSERIRPSPPRPTRPGRSRGRDPRSNGSSPRAAVNSNAGASLPKPEAKATWARTRSTRARWNSSSGPASAVAEQAERGVERAGLEAGLRGRQRPLAAPRRIVGQRDGALEERRRGGESAACLRPARRTLELRGHLLAGSRRGAGAVPGAPIGVRLGVGGLGEGAMHAVAVVVGRRAVGGGPDERMGELDARPDLEQPGFHRRVRPRSCRDRGVSAARWSSTGSPSGSAAAASDEQPGVGGELEEALGVALLDLAGDRLAAGKPEPAGELGGVVPGARQLEQRERVAVALRDDLVAAPPRRAGRARGPAAAPGRRCRRAPGWTARGARRGRRRRCPCAPRTRSRSARRGGGGRRTREPAPRRGRATARRRRCRRAAAARRPRRTASAWPGRRGSGQARGLRSARTPSPAHRAAERAGRRVDPASARRADGARCTPAPSPTRRPRPPRRASSSTRSDR